MAVRRFSFGGYVRPEGWYYRRWSYGEFLPWLFWTQNYWLSDYSYFGLPYPPPGCVWVRYGDDALLIDRYTGEIVEVIYGLFY
jgi:Ni/Co efflux regulator RcnB